jgi:hypothetical protein
VVISSLSLGRPSITAREKRVRSRIITMMSKSLQSRMVSASLRRTASVNTANSTSLLILEVSPSFSATFW